MLLLRFYNFFLSCVNSKNLTVKFMSLVCQMEYCDATKNIHLCCDESDVPLNNVFHNAKAVRKNLFNLHLDRSEPDTVISVDVLIELCRVRDNALDLSFELTYGEIINLLQFFVE